MLEPRRRIGVAVILFLCQGAALSAEITIGCALDDEKSMRYCSISAAASSVCHRSFVINDTKQEIRELNPGRILPPFRVRSWSSTALDLSRTVELPNSEIQQVIRTSIDRLTGRMIESSSYVNRTTGKTLDSQALDIYQAEQAKKFGLWGNIDRTPTTGICKATERAF